MLGVYDCRIGEGSARMFKASVEVGLKSEYDITASIKKWWLKRLAALKIKDKFLSNISDSTVKQHMKEFVTKPLHRSDKRTNCTNVGKISLINLWGKLYDFRDDKTKAHNNLLGGGFSKEIIFPTQEIWLGPFLRSRAEICGNFMKER